MNTVKELTDSEIEHAIETVKSTFRMSVSVHYLLHPTSVHACVRRLGSYS